MENSRRAFTLVEVMVVTMVLAIVLAIIGSLFLASSDVFELMSHDSYLLQRFHFAVEEIAKDLSGLSQNSTITLQQDANFYTVSYIKEDYTLSGGNLTLTTETHHLIWNSGGASLEGRSIHLERWDSSNNLIERRRLIDHISHFEFFVNTTDSYCYFTIRLERVVGRRGDTLQNTYCRTVALMPGQ